MLPNSGSGTIGEGIGTFGTEAMVTPGQTKPGQLVSIEFRDFSATFIGTRLRIWPRRFAERQEPLRVSHVIIERSYRQGRQPRCGPIPLCSPGSQLLKSEPECGLLLGPSPKAQEECSCVQRSHPRFDGRFVSDL